MPPMTLNCVIGGFFLILEYINSKSFTSNLTTNYRGSQKIIQLFLVLLKNDYNIAQCFVYYIVSLLNFSNILRITMNNQP
jgi:hypothetical protein